MTAINIQSVKAYRTIYALTGLKMGTEKLHATHYVCCLIYGRSPVWGIFLARTGNLIQCLSSKQEILKRYPGKILRPMQATWNLSSVQEQIEFDKREEHLRAQIKDDVELPEEKVVEVKKERQVKTDEASHVQG